jgi:hypothetical protein
LLTRLVPQPHGAPPPGQLEGAPPGAAAFVICDCTIEVFVQDWKVNEGWGQLTTQPDEDGSSRSLILSLRLDHCLLLHPHQLARLENKLPAYTVGSLQQRTRVDYLLAFIRELILADNPGEQFNHLCQAVEEVFQLAPSKNHLNNRDLGRLEPTPTLKYRVEMAEVSI